MTTTSGARTRLRSAAALAAFFLAGVLTGALLVGLGAATHCASRPAEVTSSKVVGEDTPKQDVDETRKRAGKSYLGHQPQLRDHDELPRPGAPKRAKVLGERGERCASHPVRERDVSPKRAPKLDRHPGFPAPLM